MTDTKRPFEVGARVWYDPYNNEFLGTVTEVLDDEHVLVVFDLARRSHPPERHRVEWLKRETTDRVQRL